MNFFKISKKKGEDTNELTIFKEYLERNKEYEFKIELYVKTRSEKGGYSFAKSTSFFAVNRLPKNGSCSVTPLNGTASKTNFTFKCQNWVDEDGSIAKYEFLGTLFNFLLN